MQDISQVRVDSEELKAIAESIRDFAVFMLDSNGNMVSWNTGAELTTGRNADEVMGQSFNIFFPTGLDVIRSERLLRISGGDGQQEEEGWCVRKDGSRFWAGVVVTSLHDKDGATTGWLAVIENREGRLLKERALEDQADDLEASNQALAQANVGLTGSNADLTRTNADLINAELTRANADLASFAYTVSHDLKEPLRTIKSFSHFLQEDSASLDEAAKDHLDRIVNAASRMQTMLEQLLAFSGLGIVPSVVTSENLARLLRNVAEGMAFTIAARNARLIVSPDLPTIKGERTRLEEVFQNLISNGLKFNRSEEPTIWIGLKAVDAETATVYVKDNGIGIDQKGLPRIFGMFERLQPRGEFEGTGAGLAIVKRALESMDGSISVESEPGVGTTFYVTLPLAEAAGAQAA